MALPFRKKKQQEMDLETAKQMLDNVFDACNYEHNTIPVEILLSYSSYRRERFSLQKSLLIVMMVLFMLLPLLFISADITVTPIDVSNRLHLSVSSMIPVKSIRAVINGHDVALYEAASHEYIVQPTENGDLTLSVTLLNGQRTTVHYDVATVDNSAPALISSEAADDGLHLYIVDTGSGIDTASISAADAETGEDMPLSWNNDDGFICIAYPERNVRVYVSDLSGNCLTLLLTPQ